MRFPSAFVAWRNLSRNRVRAVLAALGILIGVVAIAALGVFGNVLALGAADALGDIGTEVIVTPNGDEGFEAVSPRDVQRIDRVVEDAAVAPIRIDGGVVERGTRTRAVTFYGIDDPAAIYTARAGRLPEQHTRGVILGADVADDLEATAGNTVEIGGSSFRVIAVLEASEVFTPATPDDAVLLPEGAVGEGGYDQVIVRADSGTVAGAAAEDVRETVNAREERVDVFELSEVTSEIEDFFSLLSSFLIGIGAISLLVAGVSILNVMLMSTVERREEIGVLRAVGVHRAEVLRTMLFEAIYLGLAGAVGGLVVAAILAFGLYLTTPIEAWMLLHPSNAVYLVGAFGFGVLVSVVSGLYPAWKAANERPVDALRS